MLFNGTHRQYRDGIGWQRTEFWPGKILPEAAGKRHGVTAFGYSTKAGIAEPQAESRRRWGLRAGPKSPHYAGPGAALPGERQAGAD